MLIETVDCYKKEIFQTLMAFHFYSNMRKDKAKVGFMSFRGEKSESFYLGNVIGQAEKVLLWFQGNGHSV